MKFEIDDLQRERRATLDGRIGAGDKVLEVGAFYRPTVLPHEAQCIYADYYSTEELERQAAQDGIARAVAPVSIGCRGVELHEVLAGAKIDLLIANHVLEHLVDPFRWLDQMLAALSEDGRVFFALPDKRWSFDRRRADTTLAHFVSDFLRGGEISLPEHAIEAGLLYDGAAVGGSNDDPRVRLAPWFVERALGEVHPGMHVHVFQGATFRTRVLEPFLALGWLGYELEAYREVPTLGEFHVLLRRTSQHSGGAGELFAPSPDTCA
jgi:hypothetical protein